LPKGSACGAAGSCTGGLCCTPPEPVTTSTHNPTQVAVPQLGGGNVTFPYPGTTNISDLQGTLVKVTVTLHAVYHQFPDDFDILLVGPTGAKVLLWSDAGGQTFVDNRVITFDDAATAFLPDETIISSGTYRPTNIGPNDTFPQPAPAGPYATSLSVFNNTNPNGQWRLFATDDVGLGSIGGFGGGWTLRLTMQQPPVCE
jgi:hypothetical protein